MKKIILSVSLALALSGVVQAKTPSEVLKPYKEYRAAHEKDDKKAAAKYALEAWQQAEKLIGDSKITGDLAQNYADVFKDKKDKNTIKAYERAIELARFHETDTNEIWLDRSIKLAAYHLLTRNKFKAKKILKSAEEHAIATDLARSTYMGEIKTYQAQIAVSKGNHKKTEKLATEALEIFKNRQDRLASAQPIFATLYSGYGKEGQEDFVPAVMEYQKIMEGLDNALPRTHPLRMKALGRWMTMRDRITREGKLEEAEAAGLCECWPYDKKRNENVQPIKRVPPVMPRDAWQSGFAIVEFDLDDAGGTTNPRILEAWPKDVWDKSALRALRKWEYAPRTPEEVDADRTEIVVTMWYKLTDQFGDLIE